MAEWQGIFKRYLTESEKKFLQEVVKEGKNHIKNHINPDQIYVNWLEDSIKKQYFDLFSKILYDFSDCGKITYYDEKALLQPLKKWSSRFTGVSPVKLESLLEDRIILSKNCSFKELSEHLVNKDFHTFEEFESLRKNKLI